MASNRRKPLLVVLAVALAATGTASTLIHQANPSHLPNGLDVSSNAESTALYCTGLSSATGGLEGYVSFLNTSGNPRTLTIQVVSNSGRRKDLTLQMNAHSTRKISPASFVEGTSYGLAALVDGGGVVAEEITRNSSAEAPCSASGVTSWYATGFDTLVGSSAALSIYNPTATPAVLNVTVFTSSGFAAPASFQGFSVGAHSQAELNLGTQIVNASNIGVGVSVLRGSIAVVGVQQSGTAVSLNPGSTSVAAASWFPRVTTVAHALAQIRIANPNNRAVNVKLTLDLSPFRVAPQLITVAPYSTGKVVITPNPAIPESGYASVRLTSSEPVISSLASGTSAGLHLSSAEAPTGQYLISDFAGTGFNSATVTNTSSHAILVSFTRVASATQRGVTSSARLAGNATSNVLGLFRATTSLRGITLLISATKPTLLVTLVLPSRPVGVNVVAPLNGG